MIAGQSHVVLNGDGHFNLTGQAQDGDQIGFGPNILAIPTRIQNFAAKRFAIASGVHGIRLRTIQQLSQGANARG